MPRTIEPTELYSAKWREEIDRMILELDLELLEPEGTYVN